MAFATLLDSKYWKRKRSADDSISRSLQPEERVMLNTRADSITITQFFLPLLAFSCYFLNLFLLFNKPYSHESLLPLKCSCLPSSPLPPFKIHLLNPGFSPFLCLCLFSSFFLCVELSSSDQACPQLRDTRTEDEGMRMGQPKPPEN